jgi:hypothetical protein
MCYLFRTLLLYPFFPLQCTHTLIILHSYVAAVPSKRDLQTLIKAMQAEFLTAVVESDVGLVQLVCKEFAKTVKLMLSKIEGMIVNTQDVRVLSSANSFARTHSQTHNANLVVLLAQFKEALLKIPGAVLAGAAEASTSQLKSTTTTAAKPPSGVAAAATTSAHSSAGASGSSSSSSVDGVSASQQAAVREVERAVKLTVQWIEELAQKQILDTIVSLLSSYVTSVIVTIHKEGVVGSSAASASKAAGGGGGGSTPATSGGYTGKAPISTLQETALDCSSAVQTLVKQLPLMLKSHLFSLPRCDAVDAAAEELYVRILHSYVTVAALLRPVTEASRLRTAKDLAALEMLLSGLFSSSLPSTCPVQAEYK